MRRIGAKRSVTHKTVVLNRRGGKDAPEQLLCIFIRLFFFAAFKQLKMVSFLRGDSSLSSAFDVLNAFRAPRVLSIELERRDRNQREVKATCNIALVAHYRRKYKLQTRVFRQFRSKNLR